MLEWLADDALNSVGIGIPDWKGDVGSEKFNIARYSRPISLRLATRPKLKVQNKTQRKNGGIRSCSGIGVDEWCLS